MKTCALVGAADFNAEHFKERYDAGAFEYVIAVDGGFAHLEALGVAPDMALGDFDSLGYVPKAPRVAQHPAKKEQTDMELALNRAKAMRHDRAYVYGGLSGRLDHTLANLQLFAAFSAKDMRVVGVGDTFEVTAITGPDTLELPALERGTLSLLSMSDKAEGVFERGLEYELDNATISNRTSRGVSNEFIGEEVLVGVEKGTVLVFSPLL